MAGIQDELTARLHARGMRHTPQRADVLHAVHRLGHATPEQIAAAVPEIDVTTVYRTLELLEELGLVRHAHLGHGAPAYGPAEHSHIHVVCHECGAVLDVDQHIVDPLEDALARVHGFRLDRSHLTVFGCCAACSTGNGAPPIGNAAHAHGNAAHAHGNAAHAHGNTAHPHRNRVAGVGAEAT